MIKSLSNIKREIIIMNIKMPIMALAVIIFFTACNNTKYLASNQNLYVGSTIKIMDTVDLSKRTKKDLKSELQDLIRPIPNSSFLGMRIKLWLYNIAGTPTGHGLRYWLKNKVGEPPVIASWSVLEKNRQVLQNHLENKGWFKDTVSLDTTIKEQKLTAHYTAFVGPQYTIRNITFPSDSSSLSKAIQEATAKHSLLKPGNPYDLDKIKSERERIDGQLKNNGFYYFSPDYLIDRVDSTVGNHQVDMAIRVKPQTPMEAKKVYRINDVVVFADYDIDSDTSVLQPGVKHFAGYTIIDPENKFKSKIFERTLIFKPGDIYRRIDHNLSLNRLTTLGVYKFVKARFQPTDTVKGNYLNAYYYLTPTEKKSIQFQATALTKSNNSTGTELSLKWRNRNLLKGAELFTAGIYGGYEKQVSTTLNSNIIRLGVDLNLYVPRIISPWNFKTNSRYVPKTRFNAGYEFYNSTARYLLTSIRGSAGYQWKESVDKEHQLSVININYVQPRNITDSFRKLMDQNVTLARSIEKQFIWGSIYNFNFNTQLKPGAIYKRNNYYFNGNLDLSGNVFGLVSGANIKEGEQRTVFNTPFSQYIRTEAEFRYYHKLGKNSSINSRILAGIGYAYGNSTSMPFVKEFFAGGVNDIRAFRARSLGPGSFNSTYSDSTYIPDQPGDIKLEWNLEYRAKLVSLLNWAAFIDVGNIWTRKEDPFRPGAKFTKDFINQLAVGAGLGLRVDASILILRLDVAVPVRKPFNNEGFKWIESISTKDFVYNIAIGYPF